MLYVYVSVDAIRQGAIEFVHTIPEVSHLAKIIVSNFSGYALLEETKLPDDLTVRGAPYMGPELSVDIEFC
jgi:hypothetical protein